MRTDAMNATRFHGRQLLQSAVMLAFLAGCASPMQDPSKYTAPEGLTILSEEELMGKIVGNSMKGVSTEGKHWAEFYASDGAIRGDEDGYKYSGSWKITGPVMCFDYEGTQFDGCNTIALDGDQVRFFTLDGSPDKPYPSGQLVQGNPEGF